MFTTILLFLNLAGGFECGPGWQQQGEFRQFNAENLFEYMNGNAEGYIIYSFVGMRGITCTKGGVTVVADLSQMKDEEGAYGLLLSNLDPAAKTEKLGILGQVTPRRVFFAKGRFFAELVSEPEGDHTALLREMAARLEREVQGATEPPAALAWFPEGSKSVRFVPQSVLGMRVLERGYVVEYPQGAAFVVRAGADVFAKVKERFAGAVAGAAGEESFIAKDQYLGSLCIFRKGPFVAGFVKAADAATAAAKAAELASRLK